ncbi:CHAT domain-containing protein [Segatella hominis]|uniref:CHAT domain-containing protein n=1 Tax=Segatella hominis TaxID=2518605 RepID=UPI0021C609A6|nr:CHAT domain-containing protein [Segatella hominis]
MKDLQRKVNTLVLQGRYQLALDEIEKECGNIDIVQNNNQDLFGIAYYKAYCHVALSDYDVADTFISELSNQIISWKPSKQRNENLASLDYLKGDLYQCMNNFNGANQLLMSSKSYFDYESRFDDVYVNVLFSLAGVKLALGQKLKAKLYIDEANDILSKTSKSSSLGAYSITLANLYEEIGKRENAISLLERELQNLTPNVPQSAILQIKIELAYFYTLDGKYQQAYDLLSDIEYGDNLWLYELKASLSYLLKKGNVSQYIQDYNNKMMRQSYSLASHFADIEFEDYWASLSSVSLSVNGILVNSFFQGNKGTIDNKGIIDTYNYLLFLKNFVLVNKLAISERIKNDTEAAALSSQASGLYQELNDPHLSKDSVGGIKNHLRLLDKKMKSLVSNSLSGFSTVSLPTFASLKQNLREDEVMLDFFPYYEFISYDTYHVYYAVSITTKESQVPKFLKLCRVEQIDELLRNSKLYDAKNLVFYSEIWKKIERYISKKKKILISPTLNLNKVNLGAISCGAKRLGDVYQLASISSLNSLFKRDCVKENAKKSIALFGGMDYDASISVNKKNVQDSSKTKLDRSGFDYLPETLNEVTDISNLLAGVMNTTVYSGQKATESQFKLLSSHSPSVIHISTHGFYLKGKGLKAPFFKNLSLSSKITYKMSKCGLLFSGANNAWNGIYAQDVEEDCILTAAEVEKMDLSDTELVVLSACDTGLGDCESIDGVYGLSRAFKIAGAHTIVMTLWKVNDLVTKEFMCEFYAQIKEGLEYHEAFRIAQKKLRLKYQDPLLWAPFVIID